MDDLHQIKNGVLRRVPADYEFRQATKYILSFLFGILVGIIWRSMQA